MRKTQKEITASANKPQCAFLTMPQRFRAFVAGYGCLDPTSKLLTPEGYRSIAEIKPGAEVVSFDVKNQRYQLSPTSGGYPKGKANLYRVITTRGEFVASEHHRLLCADNSYRPVSSLCEGAEVFASSETLPSERVWAPEEDSQYWQMVAESLDEGHPLLRNIELITLTQTHHPACAKRVSAISSKVVRIEPQKRNRWYWDIHVAGNNNYITEDGTVHHNSGKTWVGCLSICKTAWEYPGKNQGYFAPTFGHIRDIFYPTIEEVAESMGLSIAISIGNSEVSLYSGRELRSVVKCRSMMHPQTIIGFKIAHAMIDELDVLPTDKARLAWQKIIARMRYKDARNTVDVATTPEGFRFTYDQFHKQVSEKPELKEFYGIVQASTYDNAHNLPADYIQSLEATYPSQLIEAYLHGQFVNLTSGTVYPYYNREDNGSKESIKEGDMLHIGMDFNVMNMSAVVFVERKNGFHAVEELSGMFDTPEMIKAIQEKWQNNGYRILVYPDATGSAKSAVDASRSDIALLQMARFVIRAKGTNPAIRDRVMSVNKAFEDKKIWVNHVACKELANCLEQQFYEKNGMPDKTAGHDHMCFIGDTTVKTDNGICRLDELPESGMIESIAGAFVPYEMAGKTGSNREIVNVNFADGSSVQCTPDHQFLTNGKWTKAVDLAGEYVYSNHKHSLKKGYILWLQLLAKHDKTSLAIRITFAAITFKEKVRGCIGSSINTIMGISRKALRFITKTAIGTTMFPKTLSLCPLGSIHRIIQKTPVEKKCLNLLSNQPLQKPQNGTHRLKELNGTKSITKGIKKVCTQSIRLFAPIARNISNQSREVTKTGFAPSPVNQQQESHRGSITRQSIARFADVGFRETNTELSNIAPSNADQKQYGVMVTSVQKAGTADVFCLKVPSTGCFALSNGCIVSNCDCFGYFTYFTYPIIRPTLTVPVRTI